MSEHDETLQNALEEAGRLRSEREESLREVAATEYADHLRSAGTRAPRARSICVCLRLMWFNKTGH